MTESIELTRSEQLLESLELPQGYQAELVDGTIVIGRVAEWEHQRLVTELGYQLSRNGWRQSPFIAVRTPDGKFAPDLTVTKPDYWKHDHGKRSRPVTDVAMAVEVTYVHRSIDRNARRRGYAAVMIPLYLLIDLSRQQSVLFSEPDDGDYTVNEPRPLGEPIPLPAPFGFALEGIR